MEGQKNHSLVIYYGNHQQWRESRFLYIIKCSLLRTTKKVTVLIHNVSDPKPSEVDGNLSTEFNGSGPPIPFKIKSRFGFFPLPTPIHMIAYPLKYTLLV